MCRDSRTITELWIMICDIREAENQNLMFNFKSLGKQRFRF